MLKLGQLVMLIGADDFMPPLGAVGEVVGALDDWGDYEVLFPQHPCPVPPGVTWQAHCSWLMPINEPPRAEATSRTLELQES